MLCWAGTEREQRSKSPGRQGNEGYIVGEYIYEQPLNKWLMSMTELGKAYLTQT